MTTATLTLDPMIWFDVPDADGAALVAAVEGDLRAAEVEIEDPARLAEALQGLASLPREPGTLYRLAAFTESAGSFLLLDIRLVDGLVPTVAELQEALPYVADRQVAEVLLGGRHSGVRWFDTSGLSPVGSRAWHAAGSRSQVQVSALRYLFAIEDGAERQTVQAVLSHFLTEVVVAGMDSAEEILGTLLIRE